MRLRAVAVVLLLIVSTGFGQTTTPYKTPSDDIVRMLEASPFPSARPSPDGTWLLLMEHPLMPAIEDLAQPMLALGGARISPRLNGPFTTRDAIKLTLVNLESDRRHEVSLPANPRLPYVSWSPDSRWLAFVQKLNDGLELWVADPATGKSRRVEGIRLNATTGMPIRWLRDSSGLICTVVKEDRGPVPVASGVPKGPRVQETTGERAPVRTFQDLLQNPHDEALFEYYFTSRIVIVNPETALTVSLGGPAIYDAISPSPDGKSFLVERVVRPFSYFVPYGGFAREIEVWDSKGNVVSKIASVPPGERTPIGGVREGPRAVRWHQRQPATLIYVEALDGGNPRNRVEHRDRVVELASPFGGQAREILRSEFRFGSIQWLERGDEVVWREFDRPTRRSRTYIQDISRSDAKARLLFEVLTEDRYNDPGSFVTRVDESGLQVIQQSAAGHVFLTGQGASPEGQRPFLRRMELASLRTEELFRSRDPYYESVQTVLDSEARRFITSRESIDQPPNYILHDRGTGTSRALTNVEDPQPEFRKVSKQLVTYERSDGITLSGTLYLPPDYREGERRPAFIWAYPTEYATADAASQVTGSPNRFTRVGGASHLFLLMKGFVVLDNAAMPILGGEKANDTFVEQLVLNAGAAIDFLVKRGVADADRVGVGGHSYGAFMTANLLAHSDLFRAGIARSGAYNRTLTPFAFQNEQRTYWEASEVYNRMSPFLHAHKINRPILLIHGEADNNSGTFPIQSERMYHALMGLGKPARLVLLPLESHGYASRESILHALHEMIDWMERHVKNAPARPEEASR